MAKEGEEEIPVTTLVHEEEDPVVVEEVKAEETEETEVEEVEEKEEEKPKTPGWLQRRIDREVREKHELRRELAALKSKPAAVAGTPEAEQEALIEKRAGEIAISVSAERDFTKACNTIFDAADKEFKDFTKNFKEMHTNLGIEMLPRDMVEAVIELDHSPKVLAFLAGNHEETARLLELNPTKRAIELAKLDDRLGRPVKKISAAPAPIVPVGGAKAPVNGLSDALSDEEWIERRNKQEREKVTAGRR